MFNEIPSIFGEALNLNPGQETCDFSLFFFQIFINVEKVAYISFLSSVAFNSPALQLTLKPH